MFKSIVPIIAFIAGVLLLNETINLHQIVGVAMVLFGIYWLTKMVVLSAIEIF